MARYLRSIAFQGGRPLLAALLACAVVALALMAAGADARSAKVLGKTKSTPNPSCPTPDGNSYPPRKECNVYASVTGFQMQAAGKKGLFKVPENGSIVGWSVDLGRPNREERKIFGDLFPGDPSARIAILKKQDKSQFKLTKQSPTVDLSSSFNERPIITLQKPLRVQKGRIVALTTKTWLPNFAHSGAAPRGDKWRASRRKGKCRSRNDLLGSKPHQKVGSTKGYRCTYSGARVLYWAYFVPSSR